MSTKKAQPTDDELLAQLDDLSTKPNKSRPNPKSTNTRPSRSGGQQSNTSQTEQDLLAELGNLAQRPSSRPGTPSLKANTRSQINASPKRTSTATPPLATGRTSEDKSNTSGQRKSGDSTRSSHQAFTPGTTTADDSPGSEEPEPTPAAKQTGGSSWWGGFISTATAAVSQAQAAVKDLQKNEEAQKWTEQIRGNVGALRGLSGETIGNLRTMAMPTFQSILQTVAPPISSHERLQIHITHDLTNYPSLDPTIYQVFSRVMAQVEGGDLMVVQRGNEAGSKRASREQSRSVGSWQDGPWWRSEEQRSVNAVRGKNEGSKLAKASAESFASEFFSTKGGVEEAAKKATETLSDSNPTRDSHIFLAVQALIQEVVDDNSKQETSQDKDSLAKEAKDLKPSEELVFSVYLHDPVHGISFHATSQAVPVQWVEWLDAPNGVAGALPESIEEIIESGGVDPREWASEWIEESLRLAVGVLAQRYVALRMGVGENGVKGKGRLKADMNTAQMVESGGGEAARAMGGM